MRQKRKGNKHLNDRRIKESQQNCQRVYNAIITLHNKAKTKEIKQWIDSIIDLQNEVLKDEGDRRYESPYYDLTKKDRDDFVKNNWDEPIPLRTIQRCIEKDNRIIPNGLYYSVDEQSRYETRYLDPKGFGVNVYNDVILNKHFRYNDKSMLDMIIRFGAIIMFNFIEASRPFADKKMIMRDRDDLVEYWAQNSIPLSSMFESFTIFFNWRLAEKMRGDKSIPSKSYENPVKEMEQSQIDECLKMLESCCPDIYKDLTKHRKKSPQQLG